MNSADYQCIAFERRGRVLVLQLDRPDQLNAVNARLHAELSRVFTDAELDAGSDVVVLTGLWELAEDRLRDVNRAWEAISGKKAA